MDFAIDLHLHSNHSDGALSPADLMRLCARRQLRLATLTDHDSTGGCAEAAAAAAELGLAFLPGVEISVRYEDRSIHILGLGVDVESAALQRLLAHNGSVRERRNRRILEKLSAAGMDVTALLPEHAGVLGRPHIAQALVAGAYALNQQQAFDRHLLAGGAGYVEPDWCSMAEAVAAIRSAGGAASIAHPARYGYSDPGLRLMMRRFSEAGGQAVEASTGMGPAGHPGRLWQLARHYGLAGTAGSDFHAALSPGHRPGRYHPLPRAMPRLWEAPSPGGAA